MSTLPPLEQFGDPHSSANVGSAGATFSRDSAGPSGVPDASLVQETRNQIRQLVQEISQLAESDLEPEVFYDEFLTRVVSALASLGGAIWEIQESGLALHYQINLAATGLGEDADEQLAHERLLRRVAERGEPSLIPPQSGPAVTGDTAANPTDFLLVVAPVLVERTPRLLIEIFQRPGGGPTTQRGYLRFLTQMCDLASNYFTRRHLHSLHERQQLWERLEQFLNAVHRPIRLEETCFALANEGRRLIECDRLSVAVCHGHRCRVEAVSGLDTLDRRAQEVTLLSRLATAVVDGRKPLWYDGDAGDLPPQIERPLDLYLDQSHTKLLGIIPLIPDEGSEWSGESSDESSEAGLRSQQPIGALIVEQLQDDQLTGTIRHRTDMATRHGAMALRHSLRHHRVLLRPVWEWLHNLRWLARARNLPWTVPAFALLVALIVGMIWGTASLEIPATGRLLPVVRRDVFASQDGIVIEVPVRHDQIIEPGEVLARLRSTDLEVLISGLVGKQLTVEEQIRSKQNVLLKNPRLNPLDQDRIHGELLELRETAKNLQQQLELQRRKLSTLTITSPMRGRVVTWQVEQQLLHRPVQRGQALLTIADPDSEWEIELDVPERRLGHLYRAAKGSDGSILVSFMLATHPGHEYVGRVLEVQRSAEAQAAGDNTVRVRVAIDKDELPELHHGTTVHAELNCGKHSLGYVWFHDLIETVQTNVLFWLL